MAAVLSAVLVAAGFLSGCASTTTASSHHFHLPRLDGSGLAASVDPFIGTSRAACDPVMGAAQCKQLKLNALYGDTNPSASYPRGMLQWGPDVPGHDGNYRYAAHSLSGFSLTHWSGGPACLYHDFPFMPLTSKPTDSPGAHWQNYASGFSHAQEQAVPGSYQVRLSSGVVVRLAGLRRVGVGSFTFPGSSGTILINAGGSAAGNQDQGTGIQVTGKNSLVASATSMACVGGLAYGAQYRIYMRAVFDHPFASFGTWSSGTMHSRARTAKGAHSGAWLTFKSSTVRAKVAISFVGQGGAGLNIRGSHASWNVSADGARAMAAWNQALGRIRVSGGTPNNEAIFYTALYHTLLQPEVASDADGHFRGIDGKVHLADGYTQYRDFGTWDEYRSEIPLIAVTDPQSMQDMMRSLLAYGSEEGAGYPRFPAADANLAVMVGDSADVLFAEAYVYGARDFPAKTALDGMVRGATDTEATSGGYVVRPDLNDYLKLGYVPGSANFFISRTEGHRSWVWGPASTTLEYAQDDFAIARLAKALGQTSVYQTFLSRSGSWRNLFDPSSRSIQPKGDDGKFIAQPGQDLTGEGGFVEGDSAQYSWAVPFDLPALVRSVGGRSAVLAKLNSFFGHLNAGPNSSYAWMGNEPSFQSPWIYDFIGAPRRTQNVVREIQDQLFTAAPDGLPGNDDGGAMSSWYVWSALGLYPEVPGRDTLATARPLFRRAVLTLGAHPLTIEASGPFSGHINQLTFNGKRVPLVLHFVRLSQGGTLRFVLGA